VRDKYFSEEWAIVVERGKGSEEREREKETDKH
jgi:hypothetical protein